jgi:hypothetical protein
VSAPFPARRDDRPIRRVLTPIRLEWTQFLLLMGILGAILALVAVVMLASASA